MGEPAFCRLLTPFRSPSTPSCTMKSCGVSEERDSTLVSTHFGTIRRLADAEPMVGPHSRRAFATFRVLPAILREAHAAASLRGRAAVYL
jgi:hypothetical protein